MLKKSYILFFILVFSISFLNIGCTKNYSENAKKTNVENSNFSNREDSNLYPVTMTGSNNKEIVITEEPQRIISIAPNITEIIFALGKGEKLIGRTDYCDYPNEVLNIESIGSIREPNIEKIAELHPDIVIASTHFKEAVQRKLEDIGIKVVVLYSEESFEGVYESINKLGMILNAKDKASEVVSKMQAKVNNVINKVKDRKNTPSVYYVVGYGEYGDFTAGKNTFIGKLIEMAGGENAANDLLEGWKYSLEKLVEKNPNILICSKYKNSKKGIMEANGYKDLNAVVNARLFEVDNNLLDRQGPRLADGLEQVAKIIHPELFTE